MINDIAFKIAKREQLTENKTFLRKSQLSNRFDISRQLILINNNKLRIELYLAQALIILSDSNKSQRDDDVEISESNTGKIERS